MLGHAKNLYEMYRLGKSVVNSKVFEKSLNTAKKNYQQKRKKQEKKLKRTKAGKRQLKEMKARQKATKQLWDGVTKMIQPLGKVLTSARKLANNLTKGELVKSVKKDMKKKVIQKQNCTLPVYVQADKRMVASVSLQESVDAFTIFLRKYPTAKEAKAALPTMSKYKGTYVYNQVEKAIRNGRYKSLVHFEEFMRVNGGHDPLFPRRGSGLTKNQTSNQLNINSSGNKSNSSSQGTGKPNISQKHDEIAHDGYYGRKEHRTQEYNKYNDRAKIQRGDNNSSYHILLDLTNWMKEKGMKKVKGTKRDTWQSTDGHYWQWDAEGGKLEKWNRNKNKHLGEFDPVNGKQTKPAKPGRQWDR